MADKIVICLLVLLIFGQVRGVEYTLICPKSYNPTSFAGYAVVPGNYTFNETSINQLAYPKLSVKFERFSICVVCTNQTDPKEIEICKESKALKKNNLFYARLGFDRRSLDEEGLKALNELVGLGADLSQGDFLLRESKTAVILSKSLQPSNINCPDGSQLEKFEARNSFNNSGTLRQCIVCSEGEFHYSSCINLEKIGNISTYLPRLTYKSQNCPWNLQSTPEGCQLDVKNLVKNNQAAHDLFTNPFNFLAKLPEYNNESLELNFQSSSNEGEWFYSHNWWIPWSLRLYLADC
jgi:hypothetical protein